MRHRWVFVSLLVSPCAFADYGAGAVRLHCSNDSEDVEIEAFVAWDSGQTPYPEYDVDKIGDTVILRRSQNEYFLSGDDNPVTQECSHAGRLIRVTLYQRRFTVFEPGRLLNEFRLPDMWFGTVRYLLRSSLPNKWEECVGTRGMSTRDFLCRPFDPAQPMD